jgi:DNA-binding transcriptional MerR regulator
VIDQTFVTVSAEAGPFLRGQRADHLDPLGEELPRLRPTALARVQQNRELLDAGLSTKLIRAILPCLDSPQDPIIFEGVTDETVEMLTHERERLTSRIEVLTRNRDAVARYLDELRRRSASAPVKEVSMQTTATVISEP